MDSVTQLLELQDGVISRRQAIARGQTPTEIQRRIRRRDWVVVHPGVYVNHTGPLTWRQRAYDAAILQLADDAHCEIDRIAILADACGARRTTAARLTDQLERTPRLTHRTFLRSILSDITEGTCSVLEHTYLTRVERAHRLPHGLRQVEDRDSDGRRMFRDVVYGGRRPSWRQNVELDGRLGHDSATDRDRDFERDLDAALQDTDTVRIGYGQVMDRACGTAAKLARLFQLRGWSGEPIACPSCPPELDRRRSDDVG